LGDLNRGLPSRAGRELDAKQALGHKRGKWYFWQVTGRAESEAHAGGMKQEDDKAPLKLYTAQPQERVDQRTMKDKKGLID